MLRPEKMPDAKISCQTRPKNARFSTKNAKLATLFPIVPIPGASCTSVVNGLWPFYPIAGSKLPCLPYLASV